MKHKQTKELYEFASLQLDVNKRRLLKNSGDKNIQLTPKETDVLLFLMKNAGRVVEKDEILEAVWKDTFVQEETVTRNVSSLRKKFQALGAGEAEIIETLHKSGYSFLPEVTRKETALIIEEQTIEHYQFEEIVEIELSRAEEKAFVEAAPALAISSGEFKPLPAPARQPQAPPTQALAFEAQEQPQRIHRFSPLWILTLLVILMIVVGIAAYRENFSAKETKIILASNITPFSGLPGRENSPAFSPDGRQIVFTWDGGAEGAAADVYVKLIGAGEPVRLTKTETTEEINPVFSPDGKSIAFVRVFPDHNEIILIPALGGAERKIYEKASYASLSFSSDGKLIAHANLDTSGGEAGIFTINLDTGEKTRLTAPDAPAVDHTPRFSPDGKSVAFIRYFSSFHREIFVMPVTAGGEPRQITSDKVRIYGLGWKADSLNLLFTSFRQTGQLNLWQVSSTSGGDAPQLIPTSGKGLQSLAISPVGRTIAFVEETEDENIWQIEIDSGGEKRQPLIRSSRSDNSQQFSPDGKSIVFASDRTGNYEIWLADADGKNQRQLSESRASAGSPRFSPDGKFIVYDAQIAGGGDIFVIPFNGGAPRRLTEGGKNNSLPAWSGDGQWIFFLSNRSGSDQIWKISAAGGEVAQVTRQGAFEMFAAPDGERIIYSKGGGKSGLWSVRLDGTEEQPIAELAEAGAWRSWCVAGDGVYYTPFSAQIPLRIKFFDWKTKQTREVAASINKTPLLYYSNLTASPAADGKKILYAQQDQSSAVIMLAELAE